MPASRTLTWRQRISVGLQNTRPPGPSRDIALQESGKLIRPRGKPFPSKANPGKVQVHNGIHQFAHHNSPISTGGKHERGNNGNALAGLHHSDHGVEIVESGASANRNTGASQML